MKLPCLPSWQEREDVYPFEECERLAAWEELGAYSGLELELRRCGRNIRDGYATLVTRSTSIYIVHTCETCVYIHISIGRRALLVK